MHVPLKLQIYFENYDYCGQRHEYLVLILITSVFAWGCLPTVLLRDIAYLSLIDQHLLRGGNTSPTLYKCMYQHQALQKYIHHRNQSLF